MPIRIKKKRILVRGRVRGRARRVRRNVRVNRPLPLAMRTHFFKRSMTGPIQQNSGTNPYIPFAFTYSLSSLPNPTEFENLFDRYMLAGIKQQIVCRYNVLSGIESANNTQVGLPILHWVIDRDDNNLPSNIAELQQYASYRRQYFASNHRCMSRYFKPSCLTQLYKSLTTTGYAPKYNVWIDCGYPDVPHYGLKGIIEIPTNAASGIPIFTFDVESTWYLRFKDPR